jgi:hypothetical protein
MIQTPNFIKFCADIKNLKSTAKIHRQRDDRISLLLFIFRNKENRPEKQSYGEISAAAFPSRTLLRMRDVADVTDSSRMRRRTEATFTIEETYNGRM